MLGPNCRGELGTIDRPEGGEPRAFMEEDQVE